MKIKSHLISNIRISSQKIEAPEFINVSETVRWMCAMQAQDYSMAKWAVGIRLSDPTDKKVESAFNKGEILRIHVLRPTWHFIASEDIYWMLQLSAPKIKSSLRSRHKELELTESVITRTSKIIENTLKKTENATREELANEFHAANIRTDANRLSHILFRAELDGIICSGPIKEKKLTYALLSERVADKKVLSRDESLAELAKRYFNSRCPATIQDFIWWSNLSVTDAQKATWLIRHDFCTETIGSSDYWIPNSFSDRLSETNSVFLLPAYDEFLISYKDRSSSLSAVNNKKTVSDNGMFWPVIVVNGQVTGVWKRTTQKDKLRIEIKLFHKPNKSTLKLIEYKTNSFGYFFQREIEISYMIG